jgi:hypothetical protein
MADEVSFLAQSDKKILIVNRGQGMGESTALFMPCVGWLPAASLFSPALPGAKQA